MERMISPLNIEDYESRKRNAFTKFFPWLTGIAVIGLCVALILTLSHFSGRKTGFLSQFYEKLSATTVQVQALLESGTQEDLVHAALSLTVLDTIMEDGRKFVDPDIFYNYQFGGFDNIAQTLLSGMEYNGTVLCEGFFQDGKLSPSEKEYLTALGNDLNTLKESLSQNGQANTGISIKTFNGHTHVLFSKYSDILSLGLSNGE